MPKLDMKQELAEGVVNKDPRTTCVSIAVNGAEKQRWDDLKERVKRINPKSSMAEFARRYLNEMMDDVEKTCAEIEAKNPFKYR